MSDTKLLAAFTEPQTPLYPAYFNASHDLKQDVIVLTVRGHAALHESGEYMDTGPTGQIIIGADEFARTVGEMIANCDDDIKDRIVRYATEVE